MTYKNTVPDIIANAVSVNLFRVENVKLFELMFISELLVHFIECNRKVESFANDTTPI